jgi:polysaccharide export outer membrane protein
MNNRLTITDVAKSLGITPRTIMRWEKLGRIKKSKRDWRGWRFYHKEDLEEIRKFYESAYECYEFEKSAINVAKGILVFIIAVSCLFASFIIGKDVYAESDNFAKPPKTKGIIETPKTVDIVLDELPVVNTPGIYPIAEAVKYTLGPNDIISIEVRRHPEFSGEYTVNSEGKIEYKYIGDIIVSGLTKAETRERISEVLEDYLIKPEVDLQIVAYLSKVFYVVGEVGNPGKFYMRGDTIKIREALVQAGLPTYSAAMRRSRLITPNESDNNNYADVNVYKLLYEGDLRENRQMNPGDVLYVPATLMAKVIRVISPVTEAARETAGAIAPVAAAAL